MSASPPLATDPDRAEQIAHSIPDPGRQTEAFTAPVPVVAATDPDPAEQITNGAEPRLNGTRLTVVGVRR